MPKARNGALSMWCEALRGVATTAAGVSEHYGSYQIKRKARFSVLLNVVILRKILL